MGNEKSTDQFVRDMLRDIGVSRPWEQDGGPQWKRDALQGGSKSASAAAEGKPEFVCVVGDFILLIEDKKGSRHTRYLDNGDITTEYPYRADYALNGAIHYASTMIANGVPGHKGIFAVGVGGSEVHHEIAVAFVAPGMVKPLDDLSNLDVFAEDQIDEYHSVQVLDQRPRSEVRLDDIRAAATKLHEGMRTYGSVENERKAPLVSGILLALRNEFFSIEDLHGRTPGNNNQVWDGRIIYDAAKQYMESESLMPQQKVGTLLDQFAFIRAAPQLNRPHKELGESPLKWMARILEQQVLHVVTDPSMTAFDVLGNFYHEFISYGGGDGSGLGIVLTPEHVTTLMAELIDISASDYVLDPTAGTASFLIAAMHRMFADAGDNEAIKEDIRVNRLHGIELQDKLFAIGTTNMILRGDGKANFRRDSIFEAPIAEMRGHQWINGTEIRGHGFTKVLLNPPYSQSKDKSTRNLSELAFIQKALEFLNPGGTLAAIVPQSAMVGKTSEDKARKKKILSEHTLEMTIAMNPMTFVNSGHSPRTVIAVFTAGRPHKPDAKVKFINFEKDGYTVAHHSGLVDDGTADSRSRHLIEVIRGDAQDDTSFIVRSEVTDTDEWQHSYFYFNDQPPTYEDFLGTVADYLTWQVGIYSRGLGHLIASADNAPALRTDSADSEILPDLDFKPAFITDIIESMSAAHGWFDFVRAKQAGTNAHPYVARSGGTNAVTAFLPNQGFEPPNPGNSITIGVSTSTVFYQPVPFYTGKEVQVLRHPNMTEDSGLMLVALIREQMSKFKWGNGASLVRLKATRIMVPVVSDDNGEEVVDWDGLATYGRALRVRVERALTHGAGTLP